MNIKGFDNSTDWYAYDADTWAAEVAEDRPSKIGFGPTKEAAIEDLRQQHLDALAPGESLPPDLEASFAKALAAGGN